MTASDDGPDEAFLICMSADAIPFLPAVVRRCVPCLEQHGTVTELWVTHTMAGPVDSGRVTPVCAACTEAAMDARREWTMAVAPEQVPELNDRGLLGFADQFTTHVNRTRRWPGFPGS